MEINSKKFIELILASNLMEEEELLTAVKTAQELGLTLVDYFLETNLIPDDSLGLIISSILNLPFINLKEISIATEVLELIPQNLARENMGVVFDTSDNKIKIALSDPDNQNLISYLKTRYKKPIEIYYSTPEGVKESFTLYQQKINESINSVIQENMEKEAGGKLHRLPIVKIVDILLEYAFKNRVSDIHIQGYENNVLIRFRIDGIMHDIILLPGELHHKIINRIKILSKIRTYEVGKFQDGRFSFTVDNTPTDVRVSIVPTVSNEKAVLRYLSRKNREIALEEMGFMKDELQRIKKAFKKPYGMILATGPTGSGKTTSLYGILKKLNRREVNISTIEDPVEFQIPEITQIQVDEVRNITFANGLRSLLRQDPNIIMVGEIRDRETASIAINAALTGHLLLSTLHTNDAATAMPRLLEMGVEPFLIASTVNIIVAQRLIRKICKHCKISHELSYSFLSTQLPKKVMQIYFPNNKNNIVFYKGKGCQICQGTGYVGRAAICEVLEVTKEIREAILQQVSADQIKELAEKQGMRTMIEDGLEKVQKGITSIEELLRVAKE